MTEQEIGIVTHYFGHLSVAGIRITAGDLAVGDVIHIKGHTSDFQSPVEAIQIEHQSVQRAKPGDNVGIKITGHAREHDKVFKVTA